MVLTSDTKILDVLGEVTVGDLAKCLEDGKCTTSAEGDTLVWGISEIAKATNQSKTTVWRKIKNNLYGNACKYIAGQYVLNISQLWKQ